MAKNDIAENIVVIQNISRSHLHSLADFCWGCDVCVWIEVLLDESF